MNVDAYVIQMMTIENSCCNRYSCGVSQSYHFVLILFTLVFTTIIIMGFADASDIEFVSEINLTGTAWFDIDDIEFLSGNDQIAISGTTKALWNLRDRTYESLDLEWSSEMAYSQSDGRLAYSGNDFNFGVYRMDTNPPQREIINWSRDEASESTYNIVFGINSSKIYSANFRYVYRWDFNGSSWDLRNKVMLYNTSLRQGISTIFYDHDYDELIAILKNGDTILLDPNLGFKNRWNNSLAPPEQDRHPPTRSPFCLLNNRTIIWARSNHLITLNISNGFQEEIAISMNGPWDHIVSSHDGKWLAMVSFGAIHIYDQLTYVRATYFASSGQTTSIAWSPDDSRIVTADANGVVQVWFNVYHSSYNRPPSIEILSPVEGARINNTIEISGNSSDDNRVETVVMQISESNWSIVDGTENWQFRWDTRFIENGWYQIKARAFDGERFSQIAFVNVHVDNNVSNMIPPSIVINYPNDTDVITGKVTFYGRAWGLNQIVAITITFNNSTIDGSFVSELWYATIDTTLLHDGQMSFQAVAYDGLLYSTPYNITVLISNNATIPNQRPWVTIAEPSNGQYVNGIIIARGSAFDPEDSVQFVFVNIDEGDWTSASFDDEWEIEINTWDFSNGQHHLYAFCVDDIQASSILSVQFQVDNDLLHPYGRPNCRILTPANESTVNGVITVEGFADDDDHIESVFISIAGDSPEYAHGTSNWSIEINTSNYPNGFLRICAWSNDGMNSSQKINWNLYISNNRRPSCFILTPQNGSVVWGIITVMGIAEDDNEIISVTVNINGIEDHVAEGTYPWRFLFNSSRFQNGIILLTVWSSDGQLESMPQNLLLTIRNNERPNCTIISPIDTQVIKQDFIISGTAIDLDSDNLVVEIRIDDGMWMVCNGTVQWTFNFPLFLLEDGDHILFARSFDSTDYSTIQQVNFKVERETPEEQSTSPNNLIYLLLITIAIIIIVVVQLLLNNRSKGTGN